jgi:hypothetical protein
LLFESESVAASRTFELFAESSLTFLSIWSACAKPLLSSKQAAITASARDIVIRLTREKLREQAHTSHLGVPCAA